MKNLRYLSFLAFMGWAGMLTHPLQGQENPADTTQTEKARVDTVYVEKVRVDTVYVEKPDAGQAQDQIQAPDPAKQDAKKTQGSGGRNPKVYYGGYANVSVGTYTRIGFEPLIAYKLFPRFSLGGKLSYEFVKDKRYDAVYETSNYGFSLFARRRFFKRLYAHLEYSEMNYKIYDSLGEHDRYWVSFLYLGGGISLPISKSVSLNAEVLWDLIQDPHSPYKTLQPFFNVGIGIGF
jgi:hypothetical protein